MRRILHILTRTNDSLSRQIISTQRREPDQQVEIADLTISTPDYQQLLNEIFRADSIEVW